MNKSQKGNAEFINTHTPITAYNNIMMNLNSDANKYKTNVYTYYNPAKENNMPVKQNEKGMEFHWTSWGIRTPWIRTKSSPASSLTNFLMTRSLSIPNMPHELCRTSTMWSKPP